jgi:hypothetical protein
MCWLLQQFDPGSIASTGMETVPGVTTTIDGVLLARPCTGYCSNSSRAASHPPGRKPGITTTIDGVLQILI